MINRGNHMRPDFSLAGRRDAPFAAVNMISRAVALVARNPMGALQTARAERPDDYELHESIETRAVSVPTSAATVSQFSQTAVSDVAAVIGPMSGYSLVTARSLALDLKGSSAAVLVPHMTAAPDSFGFVAPGSPIPVKQYTIGSVTLTPHKCGAIVVLTNEAAENDKLIRALIVENAGVSIDKLFFDATDTDGIRPAGLRFGVAAETSGGASAMLADLTKLAALVAPKAGSMDNIVFVASPDLAIKILLALPQLKIPVIATAGLAAGTIIAMATNALAVAASPKIEWSVSEETVLHMEDSSPAALSTVGTPTSTSAPNRSLFQTHCKALRLIFELDWKWRTTGAIAWMTSIAW
jgi:hypothetical protein